MPTTPMPLLNHNAATADQEAAVGQVDLFIRGSAEEIPGGRSTTNGSSSDISKQQRPDTATTTPKPRKDTTPARCDSVSAYCARWRGVKGKKSPPLPPWPDVCHGLIASFCGILVVSVFHYDYFAASEKDFAMLIGSFGATAVLIYASPAAPLAQPRNVLGGHLISGLIGVSVRMAVIEAGGAPEWVGAALAVCLSIAAMMASGTLHPPGGATALIAITGDAVIKRLGFLYALIPALSGAALMLLVALLLNNVHWHPRLSTPRYPQYWW